MSDLLRLLGFLLCKPIYRTIPHLYEIFYYLASARFFTDKNGTGTAPIIKTLSSNLYVIISVVMLFVFSATMIAAIVNPDLIEDKKKGVASVLKRGIVGIALIVIIPFAFDKAYEYQYQIINSHLIEKTLVGMNFKDSDVNTSPGGNGGKVIAGNLLAAVLYPDVEDKNDEVEIETYAGQDPSGAYSNMINDVSTMGDFKGYLNAAPKQGDKEYAFEFNGIIAIIAGLVADYLLLMFAIDMAIRMFKLAFFELTAPISIVAYIAAGGDTFKTWAKAVGVTFAGVFIRIAAMAFYIFMISYLDDFLDSRTWNAGGVSGLGWKLLLKLLLIIGLLIFVHKIPEIVKKAFGFEIPKTGGIRGRLENMAGVGKQAAKAWDVVKKAGLGVGAVIGAGAVSGAVLGAPTAPLIIGGLSGFANQLWKKKLSGTGFGKAVTKGFGDLSDDAKKVGKFAKKNVIPYAGAYFGAEGGVVKGALAARKKYKENSDSNYEENIKAKVKISIQSALAGIPGVTFNPTNNELDITAMGPAHTSTATFAQMTSALLSSGAISNKQKDVLDDYNKAENKLMVAKNDSAYASKIRSLLESARDTETDSTLKAQINNVLTQFDAGALSLTGLATALTAASSYVDGGGTVHTSAALTGMTTVINNNASKMSNVALSTEQLTANVTNAQSSFDTESGKLDKEIEKASSTKEKEMLKKNKSNSKKMNKENTGTL